MHARLGANVVGSICDSVVLAQRASEWCGDAPTWQGLFVTLGLVIRGALIFAPPGDCVRVAWGDRLTLRRGNFEQAFLECEAKELRDVGRTKFSQQICAVGFHSLGRNTQTGCNFLTRQPCPNKIEYFSLAWSRLIRPRA